MILTPDGIYSGFGPSALDQSNRRPGAASTCLQSRSYISSLRPFDATRKRSGRFIKHTARQRLAHEVLLRDS